MKSVCLFLVTMSVCVESYSKVNEAVPTYFARKDKNGKLVDAKDKSTWFRINTVRLLVKSNGTLSARVKVKPPMVKDGHNVTVRWNSVQSPSGDDFIALYCPENAKDNDYIDYIKVQDSPTYKQGYGERSVQLFNLRTNCQFRYFKNVSKDRQELAATSNAVMFEGGPEMPLQIHLALTGDPTEMRVMWVSGTGEKVFYKLDMYDLRPIQSFHENVESFHVKQLLTVAKSKRIVISGVKQKK